MNIYHLDDIPTNLKMYFEPVPQIGLEETPEKYVSDLIAIFSEVKRVLTKDGTLWVNIGDSYSGGRTTQVVPTLRTKGHDSASGKHGNLNGLCVRPGSPEGTKPKDLVGIPWLLAFALRADGFYLRQDIIWSKGNPMPESVTDRCTKSHEYIFLLSKSQKYYFNNEAIKEPTITKDNINRDRDNTRLNNVPGRTRMAGLKTNNYDMKNKRSVWTVNTQPFKGAHFAVFPEKLITPCILAGCPENGTVLDPFNGSGTTGVVALRNLRNYIGIELNPEYIELSHKRISDSVGLFAERVA